MIRNILLPAFLGFLGGLILLDLVGCSYPINTPKGCEEWVSDHTPKGFSCYPRAVFCATHLNQHGYYCVTLLTDNKKHAYVECRKDGKTETIFG